MKSSIAKVESRAADILVKLNLYMERKKLKPDEREDFQDLQEELAGLKRLRDAVLNIEV